MREALRDPKLPESLIENAEFVRACADHDMAQVFRMAQKCGGLSNLAISRMTAIKPENVSLIMKGKREVEDFQVYARISDGLGIPGALLGLAPRRWESPGQGAGSARTRIGEDDAGAGIGDTWDVTELLRRAALSDVGAATIETLQADIYELCRKYPVLPADMLYSRSRDRLRTVVELLSVRLRLREHRELLVSAGWLALLTGCVEYDLGLRLKAETTRQVAYQFGREADDSEIIAWSHEMAAWFALTQDRYEDTVDHVRAGLQANQSHGVAVQLAAQEAKALARMGDRRGVIAALDRGKRLLDTLERPLHVDHHFKVDPEKWDFFEMDAYRILGDDTHAAHFANLVLERGKGPNGADLSPMRMSEARMTLGVVAAHTGDLEQAVAAGTAALGNARKSLPTIRLIGDELLTVISERYPDASLALDFRDQLISASRPGYLAIESGAYSKGPCE